MTAALPSFTMYAGAARSGSRGQWQFRLVSNEGGPDFSASDAEPDVGGDRLDLLAVVRGLEALEQPSRVALVTSSRHVRAGLSHGLEEWRANDWCWERFGELTPIKNCDLWQRVDRALQFHQVECREWRFDAAHARATRSRSADVTEVSHCKRKAPSANRSDSLGAPADVRAREAPLGRPLAAQHTTARGRQSPQSTPRRPHRWRRRIAEWIAGATLAAEPV